MTERIVAAACTIYGVIISLPPPARHHTLLSHLTELRPDIPVGPEAQGFLTSNGRYVARAEAARVAIEAGQIDASQLRAGRLFSEDLW